MIIFSFSLFLLQLVQFATKKIVLARVSCDQYPCDNQEEGYNCYYVSSTAKPSTYTHLILLNQQTKIKYYENFKCRRAMLGDFHINIICIKWNT